MKIPVIHIITKLELGGAQQNTLHTVKHLDRSRYQPFLITGQGGILDPEARKLPDVPSSFLQDMVREIRPNKDLRAFQQIRCRIRQIIQANRGSPVIVHTHSSKAGILGRWAAWMEGVPTIIHTFHGFGFHEKQSPWVRLSFQVTERWTGKITHGFIMVSRANMQTARRLGIAAQDRMVLIRSGIPIREFQEVPESKDEIRRSLRVAKGEALVTMVACLKAQKAPRDFVGIAKKVAAVEPRSRFFLVGDGALRPQVEMDVRAFGLDGRFDLLGWRRDIPRILHASDILVLTSLWEGLPRVLPQAMAAGLPVVASRVDGSPEAINDGENGFLLSPGDVEGMANRVLQLIKDPLLCRQMGQEGRQRVEEFDIERMMTQQEVLYEKMAARKRASHDLAE